MATSWGSWQHTIVEFSVARRGFCIASGTIEAGNSVLQGLDLEFEQVGHDVGQYRQLENAMVLKVGDGTVPSSAGRPAGGSTTGEVPFFRDALDP